MFARSYLSQLKEYKTAREGRLNDLKKVNIFVGANNAGKSRFMRSMFNASEDQYVFYQTYNDKLNQIFEELKPQFNELYTMSDLKSLISHDGGDYAKRYNEFTEKLKANNQRSQATGSIWNNQVAKGIKQKMHENNLPTSIEVVKVNKKAVYVPILRGLRILSNDDNDVYKERTARDYELNLGDNKSVFTGQTVYEDIKRMLLGNKRDRQVITDFETFLSENFFNSQQVTLVSDYDQEGRHIKIDIGDGQELRELCNVGDGIQSIILCCFPAFRFQDEDMMLFIEEPELMMHPSVQRVLVEVLVNKFPQLQVFLTTHSNHFLDLVYDYTDDVAVFSFEKHATKEQFTISNVSDNGSVSQLLGVRNSSVFLANSVIWTEGVTDRMLFRCLLSLSSDFDYVEDYHYAFAEYGGASIKNYSFTEVDDDGLTKQRVPSISKKNLVMMDNDLAKEGTEKYATRQMLKKALDKSCVYDKYVEIENLLPYRVWKGVIQDIITKSPKISYELLSDSDNNEEKFNNAITKMRIGEVMKKYLIEPKRKKIPAYYEKNTIECLGLSKKDVMERVIDVIENSDMVLEDLGAPAKAVVTHMKTFINKCN